MFDLLQQLRGLQDQALEVSLIDPAQLTSCDQGAPVAQRCRQAARRSPAEGRGFPGLRERLKSGSSSSSSPTSSQRCATGVKMRLSCGEGSPCCCSRRCRSRISSGKPNKIGCPISRRGGRSVVRAASKAANSSAFAVRASCRRNSSQTTSSLGWRILAGPASSRAELSLLSDVPQALEESQAPFKLSPSLGLQRGDGVQQFASVASQGF